MLTTKQRGLLHLVEAEGGVTAAAARLGTSRGNVYAGLRRIVHRLGVRDTGELLRLVGERRALAAGPIVTAYRRAVAPWLGARRTHIDDLAPGARVVVGCSGGADSLALLALARARDLDVVAVYVDHGLRAGTEHDARRGRDAAADGRRATCASSTVAVDASANLEARARDARYAALERAADEAGAAAILVGAHARRPGRDGAARDAAGERHRRAGRDAARCGAGSGGRCSSCAAPTRTRSAPGCGGRRCTIR